jgi:hypothetical protein
MISPALAAGRFLQGLALGLLLGFWYGFLQPLGRRRQTLADILFLTGAFPIWLYFSFAVCRGDLGLGYLSSLFIGGIFCNATVGRLLRPLWTWFWNILAVLYRKICNFFKKIVRILKKPFASGKKSSTIKVRKIVHKGGCGHGHSRKAEPIPAGKKTQFPVNENRSLRNHCRVRSGSFGSALRNAGRSGKKRSLAAGSAKTGADPGPLGRTH